MKQLLLETIAGRNSQRPPVWFMRQAGRVLPNYMKLRERYSFKQMMENPQLCSEVTLMPIFDLGTDAAILFSDILVIPEAMGMSVDFTDQGPIFQSPLKNSEQAIKGKLPAYPEKLEYIYRNIEQICADKPAHIPLIGFCGSPLTTLLYMLEGRSTSHTFSSAIQFIYEHFEAAQALIWQITELSIFYAREQVQAGVQVFQLFETHTGLLPSRVYFELMDAPLKAIAKAVRETGTPYIYFPKGIGMALDKIGPAYADYVSIDWQIDLYQARQILPPSVGIQGNLDPRLLCAPLKTIEKTLEAYLPYWKQDKGWIFNLGHGLTPDIPYLHAKFAVDWIKSAKW